MHVYKTFAPTTSNTFIETIYEVSICIFQTESSSTTPDDPLVGSVVEVGDIRVFIRRRIGEGGFAFVYHVRVLIGFFLQFSWSASDFCFSLS